MTDTERQNPTDEPELHALKARYVFPVTSEPIPDGLVTIQGRTIVAVGGGHRAKHGPPAGHRPKVGRVDDLGNVAIVPGLVNAHTHLEFSDLAEPLGKPGMRFTAWIREVVRFREFGPHRPRHAVKIGLKESLACGTTTLGEIAQPNWQADPFVSSPLETTVFLELIGPTFDWLLQTRERAEEYLRSASPSGSWRPGLSPHAPYSVHPLLLEAVASLSAVQRVPIAMHLAESREELQLLSSGTGPFREILENMRCWDPVAFPRGGRPLDCLEALANAHRALVIHGNYLDDEEIAFLGNRADRMAVVYCPRTHAFFAHNDYPLTKLLSSGATVALGTDSRASSPDLSVLAEMRFVARKHPTIGPETVLRLGTINGARALGRDHRLGSLEPGKYADLAVVALPDREAANPYELLFDSNLPVVATWYRGKRNADR
ncbi:MAG: hypothetical protein A2V98_10340 [Planctomycetes bacterium RBG_16_64_12]|nr:MAG: hypothetical protein A2V98_10340 [Planctomycetes bacterium RBG_16_64_12]